MKGGDVGVKRSSLGPCQSQRNWCNTHNKTYGPGTVTCEWCGKIWELQDGTQGVVMCRFLGLDVIQECCGAVIDVVYQEWGEDFFRQKFEEFLGDPFAGEYGSIRFLIADSESNIAEKIKQAVEYSQSLLKMSDAAKALIYIKSLDPRDKS